MKTATTKRPKTNKSTLMSELVVNEIGIDERQQMIEEAAYYIAEQHGFSPNRHQQDWLQAEQQIDRLLSQHMEEAVS